jgi:hypothetical protein
MAASSSAAARPLRRPKTKNDAIERSELYHAWAPLLEREDKPDFCFNRYSKHDSKHAADLPGLVAHDAILRRGLPLMPKGLPNYSDIFKVLRELNLRYNIYKSKNQSVDSQIRDAATAFKIIAKHVRDLAEDRNNTLQFVEEPLIHEYCNMLTEVHALHSELATPLLDDVVVGSAIVVDSAVVVDSVVAVDSAVVVDSAIVIDLAIDSAVVVESAEVVDPALVVDSALNLDSESDASFVSFGSLMGGHALHSDASPGSLMGASSQSEADAAATVSPKRASAESVSSSDSVISVKLPWAKQGEAKSRVLLARALHKKPANASTSGGVKKKKNASRARNKGPLPRFLAAL